MNLLKKDKYRTKIMEHVLHQYANQSPQNINDVDNFNYPNNHPFESFQNIKNQRQKAYGGMLLEKVSKQRALIVDSQDSQRLCQQNKQRDFQKEQISKENQVKNILNKSQPKCQRKSLNDKVNNNILHEFNSQNHLHNESYVYHQKLPLMSISNQYDQQVLQKLKKNSKVMPSNNQNKENNKKSNNVQSQQNKEKKYRFIVPTKVAEALKSKRQLEEATIEKKQNNDRDYKTEIQKQEENQQVRFNETHRSKGSKQMLQFLQSARQKLFQSMKQQQAIQSQRRQSCKVQPEIKQKSMQVNKNFSQKQEKQSFKIQIEVSAQKTCELSLTLDSNPQKIAQYFIFQNQSQLSAFSDIQLRKLKELLSRKILGQIEKQKKLIETKKQKLLHDKHQQVSDYIGVNQVILKDQKVKDNCLKKSKQNGITTRKIQQENILIQKDMRKNKKPLQFSHIYIDNIDTLLQNDSQTKPQQIFQDDNEIQLNHRNEEKNNPELKKIMSFNPKNQQNIFEDNSSQQIILQGYLNSPHQLITYRPEETKSPQNPNERLDYQEQNQNILQRNKMQISHFPLSASLQEFPPRVKSQKTPQELTIQNEKTEESWDSVGAAKILSKSRSKLISKTKERNQSINKLSQLGKEIEPAENQKNYSPQKIQHVNVNQVAATTRTLNNISSEIISRLGKDNIMISLKQRQLTRRQKILKQKQAKQLEEIKQCSFRPKINNLSKSIDENKKKKVRIGELLENDHQNQGNLKNSTSFFGQSSSQFFRSSQPPSNIKQSQQFDKIMIKLQKSTHETNRYQDLYENYKDIQARKEFNRKKSLQLITFKPEINKISKKIIETKRNSLNNSTCQQFYSLTNSKSNLSRHHSTCKKSQQKRASVNYANEPSFEQNYQNHHQKRKSLNFSRNLEGLQIGDYLYKEAMRLKKKKQAMSKPKVQTCVKPLQKSQIIVSKIKEKKLTEYFFEFLGVDPEDDIEYDFVLKSECIDFEDEKFSRPPLKYLMPLLEQLRELDVSLSKNEFVESGLKLIDCLSQEEKAEFLGKRTSQKDDNNTKKASQPCMNKFSQQIIEKKQYYLQDIYHRSMIYKKQVKDKVELDMEDKVRKELQKCTFKPKINSGYQSVE